MRRKREKKKSFFGKFIKFLFKYLLIIGVWFGMFLFALFLYYSKDLPDINKLSDNVRNIDIYYSDGANLVRRYGTANEDFAIYSEFPDELINALIATEDKRFFKHRGVDIFGIIRAFYVNYRAGYIKQGGSTITQQLAKMMFLTRERTIKRKVQEMILAFQLESIFSKEQILSFYLNKAYFGAGKYGIKDAAYFYFNKNVSELNLEESAMLVGLLKAPSRYSPVNNPDLAKNRANQIIVNMADTGFLTKQEMLNHLAGNVDYSYQEFFSKKNQDYYFADWVKGQIYDFVDKEDGDIAIVTTLDENIQKSMEQAIYQFALERKDRLDKSQIALVVMSKDGAVLGMVGGRNYNISPFNRALHAYRQPGSAFKLFVFLTALQKDFRINDVFIDEPIAVGNWYPENYGQKYYGKVSMKEAFAKSLNSVAVQISELCGIDDIIKTVRKLGITSKIDKHDPTIALGSIQVNLLELTSAYAAIANDGYPVIPYFIRDIKDYKNNKLYERQSSGLDRVLDKKIVKDMKKMMFEVIKEGTGQGARVESLVEKSLRNQNRFLFGKEKYLIGGKTGTSQDYKDAWFLGFAEDLVIGVWIGNDDNTSTKDISGGSLPAELWRRVVVSGRWSVDSGQ